MLDVARIETHYAKSGDLNIAYQLFGDGEHRIVYIPGWVVWLCVLAFYGWLGYVMFKHHKVEGEVSFGQVHV